MLLLVAHRLHEPPGRARVTAPRVIPCGELLTRPGKVSYRNRVIR
ncbi:hypothetical protein NT01EI_1469 [Edwardsiella ictaluri 93-146]|uniref:Uncharacterized protein n=1 Tax=Edwardsiella ictaluri (strain 93-146) TaxID=634503 RepID=C5BFD7_EDWI9|nr:hypothetical protein NT01EI_1469 [Edwardsiella ictaluri 93-146]